MQREVGNQVPHQVGHQQRLRTAAQLGGVGGAVEALHAVKHQVARYEEKRGHGHIGRYARHIRQRHLRPRGAVPYAQLHLAVGDVLENEQVVVDNHHQHCHGVAQRVEGQPGAGVVLGFGQNLGVTGACCGAGVSAVAGCAPVDTLAVIAVVHSADLFCGRTCLEAMKCGRGACHRGSAQSLTVCCLVFPLPEWNHTISRSRISTCKDKTFAPKRQRPLPTIIQHPRPSCGPPSFNFDIMMIFDNKPDSQRKAIKANNRQKDKKTNSQREAIRAFFCGAHNLYAFVV